MPSKNQVILEGFLAATPGARQTASGVPVANARLATTFRRRDGQNNVIEKTEWHSLVFYDQNAELAGLFRKGDNIHVEGRLEYREFEPTGGGSKRTVVEVVVYRCYRIDHKLFQRQDAAAAVGGEGAAVGGGSAADHGDLSEWGELVP